MYTKTCPKCNQPSFSSSKYGEWDCPICQTDLSILRARDAGEAYQSILHRNYTITQQPNLYNQSTYDTYI
ncbi:hypothetical protein [Bacillus sinesaloumensis]|uniref:hypothetical protein n=1 Tax=Litchfieldia sinesaloumensis TaxID=1926280 RepID=UPI0011531733|nr:hypothetical protein [Bacillus sinesaloumensis]